MNHQQGPTHGTLLHVVCQPDGSAVWGRMDTFLCMAESLCCSSETSTTLLICYTPLQNVFGVKNKFFLSKKKALSGLCEDSARRQPSVHWDESPHQTLNLLIPWSWTSLHSRIVRNKCLLFKPPSLWYLLTLNWQGPWLSIENSAPANTWIVALQRMQLSMPILWPPILGDNTHVLLSAAKLVVILLCRKRLIGNTKIWLSEFPCGSRWHVPSSPARNLGFILVSVFSCWCTKFLHP